MSEDSGNVEMTNLRVTQDESGKCFVHQTEHDETKLIAIFPADVSVLTVPGKFGPELANRDMAAVRAEIFCTIVQKMAEIGNPI